MLERIVWKYYYYYYIFTFFFFKHIALVKSQFSLFAQIKQISLYHCQLSFFTSNCEKIPRKSIFQNVKLFF